MRGREEKEADGRRKKNQKKREKKGKKKKKRKDRERRSGRGRLEEEKDRERRSERGRQEEEAELSGCLIVGVLIRFSIYSDCFVMGFVYMTILVDFFLVCSPFPL